MELKCPLLKMGIWFVEIPMETIITVWLTGLG